MSKAVIAFQKILRTPEIVELKKSLSNLIEVLEQKNDPDPSEVLLLSELYQMFDKMSTVENIANKMVAEGNKYLVGNKLDELWKSSELRRY